MSEKPFKPYPKMRRIDSTELGIMFDHFVDRMRALGLGLKLNDYSDAENTLANFCSSGWRGIIMTCAQKFGRLIHMAWGKPMMIKGESFRDNVLDIAVYMFLAHACFIAERACNEDDDDEITIADARHAWNSKDEPHI